MSVARTFRSTQFGAPGVAAQSLGIPAAAYPGRVATNSDLIVAVDRQQTTLLLALNASATSMTVLDPSMLAAYSLLSIDNEIVKTTGPPAGNVIPISRGFDGTIPAAHLANAPVSGSIDAYHHNALVAEVQAIETALGPNLSQVNVSSTPEVFTSQYQFAPQTPGGTLSAGNQVITLTPVPKGVNGNDANHSLYISGGTGTAEAVPITGGTAVSGAASGTVIVTCANSHSGAWTIQSASSGIMEAIIANPNREIHIPAGYHAMYATLALDPTKALVLTGESSSSNGTFLDFTPLTSGPAISLIDPGGTWTSTERKLIRHLWMRGNGSQTGSDGIYLSFVVYVTLEDVSVNLFAGSGINVSNSFDIRIDGCNVTQCGKWGILMQGTLNLNRVLNTSLGTNSRLNNFGGLCIIGTIPNAMSILVDGVDIESTGMEPFTTVTQTYPLFAQNVSGLAVINSYFEGNVGPQAIVYSDAVYNLTEFNNFINNEQVVYGNATDRVNSWGNTFYGTNAIRVLPSNTANYVIGPDYCLNGSPESTNHPRMLGMAGSTGAGSAALGANSPATVLTAPYTWLKTRAPDGTIVFLPAWK